MVQKQKKQFYDPLAVDHIIPEESRRNIILENGITFQRFVIIEKKLKEYQNKFFGKYV